MLILRFVQANVEGHECSECKPGYFALDENRADGCLECFCSGMSDHCTNAVFYRAEITSSSQDDVIVLMDAEYA